MINEQSQRLADEAKKFIPWGTQTNAKRPNPEYLPQMPQYIERASGCMMYDVDGNEYIDFRASLGPIILGYTDGDVDIAVKEQIDKGILFSMAAPQELELAKIICDTVPCAEMVRFLKNGGDACSASIKLARACSGRDEIVSIGYHGWHDWYTAGRREQIPWWSKGVPKCMDSLVHQLDFCDLSAAEQLMNQRGSDIAAIIISPYDWESDGERAGEYLQGLRKLCDKSGALLIFDEVVTGFRLAMGGAGEYFGVVPDLAVFGKAVANGYPIAVIAGKRKYMEVMQDIFVTITHGGELASIAAAVATLQKLKRCNVYEHIFRLGKVLGDGFTSIFNDLDIPLTLKGLPVGNTVVLPESITTHKKERPFASEFIKAVFANGLFWSNTLFTMYSHSNETIAKALAIVEKSAKQVIDA